MARKILIDTDPGIDDAMALALALTEPSLDVIAVTATGGNIPPCQATRNLQILIEQLDPPRLPRIGEALPNQILRADARELHGPDGLGGAQFRVSELQHRRRADKLICDTVRENPGQLTILCLGPLSNIAAALQREPELASLIGHLVIMGGAIAVPGDITPVAEFSIYCDAEAARSVFRSPVTSSLVPLDVTRQVLFSYDLLDHLPPSSTRTGAVLRKILPCAFRTFYQRLGIEGVYLHDVIALIAAIHPDLFTSQRMYGDVETEGELTHGMTVFDRRFAPAEQPNLDVMTSTAAKEVLDCILQILAQAR